MKNIFFYIAYLIVGLGISEFLLFVNNYPNEEIEIIALPPNTSYIRNNLDFSYHISTNKLGLRDAHQIDKPGELKRTFVLGDSYVFGVGVEQDQTFCAVLEKTFEKTSIKREFINGGLPGSSIDEYAKILFQLSPKYQPDEVLLCIYGNDLTGMPLSPTDLSEITTIKTPKRQGFKRFSHQIFPRLYMLTANSYYSLKRGDQEDQTKLDFIQKTKLKCKELGISEKQFEKWLASINPKLKDAALNDEFNDSFLSMGLIKPHFYSESLTLSHDRELKWKNFQYLLQLIKVYCTNNNISLRLVYIPVPMQYDAHWDKRSEITHPIIKHGVELDSNWIHSTTLFQDRLKLWSGDNQTPFLDLTDAFRQNCKKDEQLIFDLDLHWNKKGHKVCANAIYKWL